MGGERDYPLDYAPHSRTVFSWARRCRMRAASVDDMVRAAAVALMAATTGDCVAVSERVLSDLVDRLDVDVGFLRHNDHTNHLSELVAESPLSVPASIRLVHFADAGPTLALTEHFRAPMIRRLEPIHIGSNGHCRNCSVIYLPLLSGDLTTGVLGLIKIGDREWAPEELDALRVIAALFAQLQSRIVTEEQVHYFAHHDERTGLLNHRSLVAHLDDRLALGQQGPVAVLWIDIDRLKAIVNHVGHVATDQFIAGFAHLLREAVDVPAAIAHPGGDEFVVVPDLPMDTDEAVALAHRLKDRVHKPVIVEGEMLTRTVSIGVATGLPGHDTSSDLLRRADQITPMASSGGGRVAPFNAEVSERFAIRSEVELHLEQFIDDDDGTLSVQYLPEFDLRTGKVLGTEALVRWHHPTRGVLMPESFAADIESINLAAKLGRYVMHSACAAFKLWLSRGMGQHAVLRLNLSPVQLVTEGIAETVEATLEEFGLDANSVCLEVTESVMVHDIDVASERLAALRKIGVQIAIDDFGTGYSALAYLKSLPVDILKIDKGFVRDLGIDPGNLAIVQSIIGLADAFELEVVAEGVEAATAAKTLLDLGCNRAQGFLLSPPLDSAAMESLLARRVIPVDFLAPRP